MAEQEERLPPQDQERQPGIESEMEPRPRVWVEGRRIGGKLAGRVAIVTGGDSGIGRAVAVLFAREGASLAIVYLDEHGDAAETKRLVEREGGACRLIAGDVGNEDFCRHAVDETVRGFGRLDILVNNAGEQHPKGDIEEITAAQLERTFRTNIFGYFFMTKAALPHLGEGAAIVNSTSVTAYRGSPHLLDYSASKGAIVSFTRSLSLALVKRGIRVNGVAPGPIWTPLVPSAFTPEEVQKVPMGRPGQAEEAASCYVFLASDDCSYMSGQVLHPNGGEIINT
jgi:NAD(P)-dependent dehydrogenase (short-subunit alcohol dehydrogenase family)